MPRRFVKIRNYGYLRNYKKQKRLNAIFEQMNLPKRQDKVHIPMQVRMLEKYGRDMTICPHREQGKMQLIYTYKPSRDFQIPNELKLEVDDFNTDKPPS